MAFTKIPHPDRWEIDRFWSTNFQRNAETDCLEWQKSTNPRGYGRTSIKGVIIFAHRFAYFLYYGIDPGELWVLHKCDNPRCSNPLHLELGTPDDNSKDMVAKGRSQSGDQHWTKRQGRTSELQQRFAKIGSTQAKKMNGANHPATKLNAEQVIEIRKRRAQCGDDRQLIGQCNRELAEKFGVNHRTISTVGLGKTWQTERPVAEYVEKMTPEKVREIRRKSAEGQTRVDLAAEYGVSKQTILYIVTRKAWKHIE